MACTHKRKKARLGFLRGVVRVCTILLLSSSLSATNLGSVECAPYLVLWRRLSHERSPPFLITHCSLRSPGGTWQSLSRRAELCAKSATALPPSLATSRLRARLGAGEKSSDLCSMSPSEDRKSGLPTFCDQALVSTASSVAGRAWALSICCRPFPNENKRDRYS